MTNLRTFAAPLAALATLALSTGLAAAAEPRFDSGTVSGLGARNIGPAVVSGRIAAIAGRHEASGKTTLLVGAASGGVWKSTDGGTTFKPIFDKQPVQSIGAHRIRSQPSQYVSGSARANRWTRNSVSIGDGVYKSTDGGDSWANVGLPNSERIAKIVVDPRDGEHRLCLRAGKLWSDRPIAACTRRPTAARRWTQVLKGPNLSTGCSSLSLDPANSETSLRRAVGLPAQGLDVPVGRRGPDGAFRQRALHARTTAARPGPSSTPSSAQGLPNGPWGRVAVSVAPSDSTVVYAFIESVRSALFRSDDGGKTWDERDRSQQHGLAPVLLRQHHRRPEKPRSAVQTRPRLDRLATTAARVSRARKAVRTATHHDLWIDPSDTQARDHRRRRRLLDQPRRRRTRG